MDFKKENSKIACNKLCITKTSFENLFFDTKSDSNICNVSVDNTILGHYLKIDAKELEQK